MLLLILTVVAANEVSAQNVCSEKLDGKQVYVEIANITNKAFIVNLVDGNCKEIASTQQTPSVEIFSQILTNGQAFRVREAGTNKLLHQAVVNPVKPIIFIETDLDGSNLRTRDFEAAGDNEFKKRADAAFAAVKSAPEDSVTGNACSKKLGEKSVNIKWLNKTNESLIVYRITEYCREEIMENVGRNETFETTAYPGEIFHFYIQIESDEGGTKDFRKITVTDSNGIMTLK